MIVNELEMIATDNILATAATQVRTKLHKDVIEAYREDLEAGQPLPPIVVFREKNSERFILADGFHRLYAAINAGWTEIGCEVHEGDLRAALLWALGANSAHGLRRTNADKRHAVEMALKDPEISQLTRQEIADICRVTKRTVQVIANREAVGTDPDANGTEPGQTQEPADDDIRDTGADEPTQEAHDREEIRIACKMIAGLPYPGEDAVKLELSPDDLELMMLVSGWLSSAVIVTQNTEG